MDKPFCRPGRQKTFKVALNDYRMAISVWGTPRYTGLEVTKAGGESSGLRWILRYYYYSTEKGVQKRAADPATTLLPHYAARCRDDLVAWVVFAPAGQVSFFRYLKDQQIRIWQSVNARMTGVSCYLCASALDTMTWATCIHFTYRTIRYIGFSSVLDSQWGWVSG